MSIEAALADLAAALRENTATLKALTKGTTAAAGSSESKPAASKAATPAKAAAAPTEEAPKKRGRPAAKKSLTTTEMAEKARLFCEAADTDEDEFKARRGFVKEIATEFGVEKFSAITGDDQEAALQRLAEYEADDDGEDGGEEGAEY